MSYLRKRKHRSRRSPPAHDRTHPSEPDPSLFITAHEADVIRGPQAASAADSLEIAYATSQDGQREILKVGDGLMKWERYGNGEDEDGDVWVDRYDARLLLDALPFIAPPPPRRAPSPSGWSDLPSDAEDTFFFSPEEAEDYHRAKRRRLLDQLREERLRAREAEDGAQEEQWGGSDEEPDDAQAGVMRRTAAHVVASPNAAQLEMRILANHGADPRFAFLRGRWGRAWARTKAQARGDVAKEKEGQAGAATALGGLMGYEGSDDSEDGDDEADAVDTEEKNDGDDHGNEGTSAEDSTAEQAIKEARRARAREWAEKRRATKVQSPEPVEPS